MRALVLCGANSSATAIAVTLAAALVFGVAPASAASPAYAGKWATSAAACKSTSDMVPSPIVLEAKKYYEDESICDLKSVRRVGATWRAKIRCNSFGTISNDTLIIWASKKHLTLKFGGEKKRANYVRCQ